MDSCLAISSELKHPSKAQAGNTAFMSQEVPKTRFARCLPEGVESGKICGERRPVDLPSCQQAEQGVPRLQFPELVPFARVNVLAMPLTVHAPVRNPNKLPTSPQTFAQVPQEKPHSTRGDTSHLLIDRSCPATGLMGVVDH